MMRKAVAIMLCLLLLLTVAAPAEETKYIYNVTIVMNGLGIIPLEADEPPIIAPSGVVIIKCEGEYYFAALENVIIMMTEDNGTEEEDEVRKVPRGDLYMEG